MATQTHREIELLSATGAVLRRVSTAPPRLPTDDEIPIIDLESIDGTFDERNILASRVKAASENTGFFYVRNHGIPEELIQNSLSQAKAFFDQQLNEKMKIDFRTSTVSAGYHGVGSTQVNRSETRDLKETFSMRYDSRFDPTFTGPKSTLEQHNKSCDDDDYVWKGTSHLPGFREVTVSFWQSRLALARKLVRIFALALGEREDYFDGVITHPGADALYIHYPGIPDVATDSDIDVGIGSHTDFQCFTLLWQDNSGGLQVLSAQDEWLDARPIEGTLVVNIGDFLQRLSNNRFKSTVHRVYNHQPDSRYSMPFFFGFNPETVCRVVPSCVDDEHPPLYEPISCGEDFQVSFGYSYMSADANEKY
ncbi:2OG-Fe(II) oxygenase superfamily protein [Aspergillus bertholletiae]|uniref:2OG-Fe(II) oxygenase superfamily protein n=1 Tax=Aspergillus bertholletiae TaxID=1226010 RepID=A0A5N7ANI3_9EURO|nr:2OG-Fe(II) oxygenase superfamily protein [Aspergillus bertholletiae]